MRESLRMDPNLYDAYVGIGTYMYWRSRLVNELMWLPFVRDEREEGIRLLRIAEERSRYSRVGAKCQLIWILVREGRFAEGVEIGRELYAQYPRSSVVIFGYATALLGRGELQEAEGVYKEALRMYEGKYRIYPYAMECRWGLAKVYFQQGEMRKAELECQRILEYDGMQGDAKWSASKMRAARRLLEAARAGPGE